MSEKSQDRDASLFYPTTRSKDNVKFLDDEEIQSFIDDLDRNGDGHIDYSEVEHKLDQTHDELVSKPDKHHVIKKNHDSHDDQARHSFLRRMMGNTGAQKIPRDDFVKLVKSWQIPSLKQAKKEEEEEKNYFKRLPGWRKIRAYFSVHGPEIGFLGLVIAMQLAFGIWQLVKYQTTPQYRAAFGWGVVMAKTCAGALYPTFFFLILSMSRYFSTWLRRSYYISRFLNWDLSQSFHIRISCLAILLATLHAIGHLTGSFVHGSNPNNEAEVARVLGPDAVPRPYIEYVRSLPGFTGITALGLFYTLSILSIPQVRKWNYEIFQLGHLLMFPIIGLMMAHGTAGLLQWPMFGYFLAFPTLLVVAERLVRVFLGFHRIPATLKVLDGETVEITATVPPQRVWKYKAGQYIFLQVPRISFFQWHPFTVSLCQGNQLTVHIKTDGNWTSKLRKLGGESGESKIDIGINGPFGAPAQRFYDFDHSIMVGAGIGVTPFSGILADLQHKDDDDHGVAMREKLAPSTSHASNEDAGSEDTAVRGESSMSELVNEPRPSKTKSPQAYPDDYRRVDFHWMVRDRNYLLWLSDLLNDVFRSQEWHRKNSDMPHLDIRLYTHVTAKRKAIATHVYRWLLEMHRTKEHPASPLTGLLNPTHFGRPDFDKILDEHYAEMLEFQAMKSQQAQQRMDSGEPSNRDDHSSASSVYDKGLKVGVFYCGAPVVGEILADKCRDLSTRGRHDGSKIEYHFMIEVFG